MLNPTDTEGIFNQFAPRLKFLNWVKPLKEFHLFDFVLNLDSNEQAFNNKYKNLINPEELTSLKSEIINFVDSSIKYWLNTNSPLMVYRSFPKILWTNKALEYINDIDKLSVKNTPFNELIKSQPKLTVSEWRAPTKLYLQNWIAKHNLDIDLTNYLLKAKQNTESYNKIVEWIWDLIIDGYDAWKKHPLNYDSMSFEEKYFNKILENLSSWWNYYNSSEDLLNYFNRQVWMTEALKPRVINLNESYKYSIKLPNGQKKYFYSYDNKPMETTTKPIKFPEEIVINFNPNKINLDRLESIKTSDHIKSISAPVIDYITKAQHIAPTKQVITPEQINTTVESYLKDPSKFEKIYVPSSKIGSVFEGIDEISTGLLILLSEMVAVGYAF